MYAVTTPASQPHPETAGLAADYEGYAPRTPIAGPGGDVDAGHGATGTPISAPEEIRVVDLCAGLGGFHRALQLAEAATAQDSGSRLPRPRRFRCVLAAELDEELRELYVQNFPHIETEYIKYFPQDRLASLPGLDDLYEDGRLKRIHGDIRHLIKSGTDELRTWSEDDPTPIIPSHDLLCAGFPCQPFSKSGAQKGFADLNGTVFRMLAVILSHHKPRFVMLENVGNFQAHDKGNTWKRVRQVLTGLGYEVRATTHVGGADGGEGLLSPHHLGLPHHRERFFIVAQRHAVEGAFSPTHRPFPRSPRSSTDRERVERIAEEQLRSLIASSQGASEQDLREAQVHPDRVACVEHWAKLLECMKAHDETQAEPSKRLLPLPSFPIWGYELDPWNHYPYKTNPADLLDKPADLIAFRKQHIRGLMSAPWWRTGIAPRGERAYLASAEPDNQMIEQWTRAWPQYARARKEWPSWKSRFIDQNRDFCSRLWSGLDGSWLREWLDELYTMTPSHQKLEWNCLGDTLNIWDHILQFRPSGLRVKRFRHVPALVAMTSTQVPIVPRLRADEPAPGAVPAAKGRHLLPVEALMLQGFPTDWRRPAARGTSFRAFGNAVHAALVSKIVIAWLFEGGQDAIAQPGEVEEVRPLGDQVQFLWHVEAAAEGGP